MVFYLMFSFGYLVYHSGKFLVILLLQYIPTPLRSLYWYADDTCMLYISLEPENGLHFSSSLKYLEHCVAHIRLWVIQQFL